MEAERGPGIISRASRLLPVNSQYEWEQCFRPLWLRTVFCGILKAQSWRILSGSEFSSLFLPSLSVQGAGPEDFSNLPPEQRRKKLQQKVDELNKDIQKEMDQRYVNLQWYMKQVVAYRTSQGNSVLKSDVKLEQNEGILNKDRIWLRK